MSNARVGEFQAGYKALLDELSSVIVGHNQPVEIMCAAFLSGGHVLMEGVPGLGKTLLASSFARASGLEFKKIQFTPDLMPADITGTNIINDHDGKKAFEFQEGALFANIVLADEINRATPKTQSALLEGMQEKCVTVGGETRELPRPFTVIGTQNPLEMKGTYPLPEAQKDRFMFKVDVKTPNTDEMTEILKRTTGNSQPAAKKVLDAEKVAEMMKTVKEIAVADPIRQTAARMVMLTDPGCDESPDYVKKYVRLGASIRGGQALIAGAKVEALVQGQVNASASSLLKYILPALRHRLILNFEAGADGIEPDQILAQVGELIKRD